MKNTWNIDNIEETFQVLGRGLILVVIPEKNNICFAGSNIPILVGDICIHNSTEYTIQGIECYANSKQNNKFGLIVK